MAQGRGKVGRGGGETTVRYTEDSFRWCGGGYGGPGMERAQFRAILRIVDTSYEKSVESFGTFASLVTRLVRWSSVPEFSSCRPTILSFSFFEFSNPVYRHAVSCLTKKKRFLPFKYRACGGSARTVRPLGRWLLKTVPIARFRPIEVAVQ